MCVGEEERRCHQAFLDISWALSGTPKSVVGPGITGSTLGQNSREKKEY